MKLALMLGGMAAGRRAGGPGELLSRGTKLLETSPELSRLVGDVRGRLLEAGKGAALAVATRQVEALTDRVGKRVESLGTPQRGRADDRAEEEPETDGYAEDEYAEDEGGSAAERDEEPAEEEAPPPRRRTRAPAAKATAARAGKGASASATVKRTASGAGRAAGRKPARTARTQRSNGDG